MVSAYFLFTDCLSSCAIPSANGAFIPPVTLGFLLNVDCLQQIMYSHSRPLLTVKYLHTTVDFAENNNWIWSSRKITKSWFHILPIHNAEIDFYLHAVVGIIPRFPSSFHDMAFLSDYLLRKENKSNVSINLFICPMFNA